MNKLRDALDRFCARHPRFGIPNLMLYVVIGNVAVYLLSVLTRANDASAISFLTFSLAGLLRGEIWRIITFIFVPQSSQPFFLLISLYFYYWIGSTLEREWGTARFTLYYLSGTLLTVLGAILASLLTGQYWLMVAGTTYVNLSMFLAFAFLFPDMQVLLFFIIPVKMKYLALVDAAFFLISVITTPFPENLLPVVAVLNFLIFCSGDLKAMLPRRQSKGTINFKRESARIRREQQDKLYTHKCAVCGRTDTDYPDLEFRYCSRCAGYHCFCSDHINNHIHFTE